jgi:hypothetical protein
MNSLAARMVPLQAATNTSAEGGFVKRNRLLILILVTLATLVAYPCSSIIIPHEIDPNEKPLDNLLRRRPI